MRPWILSTSSPAIELVDVVKRFGSAQILNGVSLTVPPGEITVLLGPSGAGKTVTINHVVGLLRPNKGKVLVEGRDLAMITDEELYAVRRRWPWSSRGRCRSPAGSSTR